MLNISELSIPESDVVFHRLTPTSFNIVCNNENNVHDTRVVIESSLGGLVDTALLPVDEHIHTAFCNYKLTPTYQVGLPVVIKEKSLDTLITQYETLIAGICLHMCDKKFALKRIESILNWLRSTDFYRSPASTVYHGSFVGGLLVHSLEVYNQIISLKQLAQFECVDLISASLVALTHDWCKIGLYEVYDKNVKNAETNQWEQVKAFKRNQTGVPLGHGTSSMFLVMRFFPNITPEEACAIRWHQGHWNCCEAEENEFQRANEIYPLVHLLQFADQLSITQYANQKFN